MARTRASLLASWLTACSGGPAPGETGPFDSGSVDDTGEAVAEGLTISGVVLDLEGEAVVDVFVTVSTEYCIPDRTATDGSFTVEQVVPGTPRLITYGETASNGLFASVVFPIEAASDLVLAQPVVTPELTELLPLEPDSSEQQVLTTEDGLELTIPASGFQLAPFAPEELQVARVPVARAPDFVPGDLELVDLFVLHPIQSTFDPPAPLAFPADLGLSPGQGVVFWTLDYETGLLAEAARGTVDDDGHPRTTDGSGISELTWVGLSLEET